MNVVRVGLGSQPGRDRSASLSRRRQPAGNFPPPHPRPTRPQRQGTGQVRAVARQLLETLKHEKFVLDWRKKQQSRSAVRVTIEEVLDTGLPPIYTANDYQQRWADIYQHIYDAYIGPTQNIYTTAA